MYRSIHENKRATRKANRNIIFLILFAGAMIWSGVWLSELREERLAIEIPPSAETVAEVTGRLCVEIDDKNHLVVCPE